MVSYRIVILSKLKINDNLLMLNNANLTLFKGCLDYIFIIRLHKASVYTIILLVILLL